MPDVPAVPETGAGVADAAREAPRHFEAVPASSNHDGEGLAADILFLLRRLPIVRAFRALAGYEAASAMTVTLFRRDGREDAIDLPASPEKRPHLTHEGRLRATLALPDPALAGQRLLVALSLDFDGVKAEPVVVVAGDSALAIDCQMAPPEVGQWLAANLAPGARLVVPPATFGLLAL
ncbi:MAG: hypothetical protein FJZ01_02035 [Candidatus Sericytochromatia bacterium]|nr:hypothetical protein [Candidatus Tanganyikabacteria bacterium]